MSYTGRDQRCCQPVFFPLPLHLWLMEGDARGWGWMDRETVRTEFLSSAILALVWGSDHSHSGLWLPCSRSGQSFCPCLLFLLPPPPVVYNTHKRRQDLEARLQILFWDLRKHHPLGLDLLFPGSSSGSELLGEESGKIKMLSSDPST